MPDIKMPEIKIPDLNTDVTKAAKDVAAVAKDATYVVIGAGVLGFQQAQVQRQELISGSEDPKAGLSGPGGVGPRRPDGAPRTSTPPSTSSSTGSRRSSSGSRPSFAPFEDRLPTQARDLAKQAHVQAQEARTQLRTLLPTAGA